MSLLILAPGPPKKSGKWRLAPSLVYVIDSLIDRDRLTLLREALH